MRSFCTALVSGALVLAAGCDEAKPAPSGASAPKSELSTAPYSNAAMGALQVLGETRDWFVISQNGKGLPGNPPVLNSVQEVAPGDYEVTVNKTVRKARVEAGRTTILLTGTLVVEGSGGSWWYPEEAGARRVASNPPTLGTALALFAGRFDVFVHVGMKTEPLTSGVAVSAGERTVLRK